ncbi:MAG: glycosyltransferase family 2 protein [Thermoplasmata archaeon]|nr:glycosyltransferase family 2 protein [Thermoplasmata archaeon]
MILPTLNEEQGLLKTLEDIPLEHLREAGFDPQVLVVDGHSTDGTQEVGRSWGARVISQTSRGKGAATREGIEFARSHGAKYAVVMDADYTYPGSAIVPLLTLLEAGSDLVVGVRRPEFNPFGVARNLIHRVGDGLLNYTAAQLSRCPVLDVCSGLWGVRTAIFPGLKVISDGFEIEAEVFLKSFRSGLRVSQIPIAYRARVGTAKLRAVRDGARILLTIIRNARSPSRGPAPPHPSPGGVPSLVNAQALQNLQALCFATDAKELVIFSHQGREVEAQELARRLRAARVGVEVIISSFDSVAQSVFGAPSPLPLGQAGLDDGRVPIVVTLPSVTPGGEAFPAAIVGLPKTQRVVYVPLGPMFTGHVDPFSRSGAYRLEGSRPRPSSLSILSSAISSSVRSKELALLAANAPAGGVRIYRSLEVGPGGGFSSDRPRAQR